MGTMSASVDPVLASRMLFVLRLYQGPAEISVLVPGQCPAPVLPDLLVKIPPARFR
jgi:hypothetical protein